MNRVPARSSFLVLLLALSTTGGSGCQNESIPTTSCTTPGACLDGQIFDDALPPASKPDFAGDDQSILNRDTDAAPGDAAEDGGDLAFTCSPPLADCDHNPVNGCETNTTSSPDNCGGCGRSCSGNNIVTRACMNGICSGVCVAGFADCNGNLLKDGCEAPTAADVNNCGRCAAICSAVHISTPLCAGGLCTGVCDSGFADCNNDKLSDGCETPTGTDLANCGECGAVCSGAQVLQSSCVAGACVGACQTGFADCNKNELLDGCEANLQTSAANCGSCAAACSTNHIAAACSGGNCSGACLGNFADCNSDKRTDGCEVDTSTDPLNCGGCAAACSTSNTTPSCVAGSCIGTCAMGFGDCDNNPRFNGCETNLEVDAAHCGACATPCSLNHVRIPACSGGVCVGACAMGFADCNANEQSDGCETDIAGSPANCGGCGLVCSTNHVPFPACAAGRCSGGCDVGFADCNADKFSDGCEVSTLIDPMNCGGCSAVCSGMNIASPTCHGGVCDGACDAGFADCNGDKLHDGCEIITASDPLNCGKCGNKCSGANVPTPSCMAGLCNGACSPGFLDCNNNELSDGCEIDGSSNVLDCGSCAAACSTNGINTACSGGACTGVCNAGRADCNGNKRTDGCEVNLLSDSANCGNCGQACPAGAVCANGSCTNFVPSHVAQSFLSQGGADLTVNSTINTTALTVDGRTPGAATPFVVSNGLAVLAVRSFTVPQFLVVTVSGARPLVVIANGSITIAGTLDAGAPGVVSGPGGGGAGKGLGAGARGSKDISFDNADSGGAGGGYGAFGGDSGTAGGSGCATAPGASGGAPYGDPQLTQLYGGSGGGYGSIGGLECLGGGVPFGGGGGGAMQLSSPNSITVTGFVNAGGGGGQAGCWNPNQVDSASGGGGGSGGSILLEAIAVDLSVGTVTANGGSGGGGAAYSAGGPGGPGRESAVPTPGGYAGGGGDPNQVGGAGGTTGAGATSYSVVLCGNSGGGGGSTGRIYLRSRGGVIAGVSTTVSPPPVQDPTL